MQAESYAAFLATKRMVAPSTGVHVEPEDIHPSKPEYFQTAVKNLRQAEEQGPLRRLL